MRTSCSLAAQVRVRSHTRPKRRATFERRADFSALLTLRRADDRAKVAGLRVPGLAHWRAQVESLLSTPTS